MSDRPLQRLASFWVQELHPHISTLIVTMGTVGLGVCFLILFVTAKLSTEVFEQDAFAFDKTILLWIHQFANPTLDAAMLTVTRLGNPGVVVPLVMMSFALLWWSRYRQEAYIFALNCIGGAVLATGLKLVFNKTRPQLWPQLITESTFSYPSGHALGSMVFYGFLAYILAQHYPRRALIFYGFASVLILIIGFSRLYLGVHWPTDIMGGYGIGFLWLSICITMLRLQALQPSK
ncbi:MAG: phosphatase PAP2 family protein [Thermosynechococcaceae cyanobacterium]